MSHKISLSQSNIKEMASYFQFGECGFYSLMRMMGVEGKTSDAMNLGCYFEFLLTGARPKNGRIPKPVRLKPAKGEDLGALNSDYQFAKDSVEEWNKYMKQIYGFEFDIDQNGKPRTGLRVVIDNWKGTGRSAEGTYDSIMVATKDVYSYNAEPNKAPVQLSEPIIKAGEKVIVDTKFSGLVGDIKDPLGWHPLSLSEKVLITTQAIHYKYMYREVYGEDIHFMFTVMSAKKNKPPYFFYIHVSEEMMEKHEQTMNMTHQLLHRHFEAGTPQPRPSMEKCMDCPYKEYTINGEKKQCEFAVEHPFIYQIDLI